MAFSFLEIYEMFVEESTRGDAEPKTHILQYISDMNGTTGYVPRGRKLGFIIDDHEGNRTMPIWFSCSNPGCKNTKPAGTGQRVCSRACRNTNDMRRNRLYARRVRRMQKYDRERAKELKRMSEEDGVNYGEQ